ncbi:MAG: hypothetical protein IJ509_02250 [Bacilli bacterium]|nr:hypothetical protein [Bacilli bacterium]
MRDKFHLDNRGFAITGIIYTLFILFLTILLSVLSTLSLSRNLSSQSIKSLEDDFEGKEIEISTISGNNAPYFGKYIFDVIDGTGATYTCTTYLKKGAIFDKDSITWTTKDCNDYEVTSITLEEVYSFEE